MPYIFFTLTAGIVLILLSAKTIDFIAFHILGVTTADPLSDNFLLRATFWSGSLPLTVISSMSAAGFLFLTWKYGGRIFKRLIAPFSISPDMLDDITYKSIVFGFPFF
ncbi:hypothetical protein, partial [Candidatus Hakubella thermalkaliphila]